MKWRNGSLTEIYSSCFLWYIFVCITSINVTSPKSQVKMIPLHNFMYLKETVEGEQAYNYSFCYINPLLSLLSLFVCPLGLVTIWCQPPDPLHNCLACLLCAILGKCYISVCSVPWSILNTRCFAWLVLNVIKKRKGTCISTDFYNSLITFAAVLCFLCGIPVWSSWLSVFRTLLVVALKADLWGTCSFSFWLSFTFSFWDIDVDLQGLVCRPSWGWWVCWAFWILSSSLQPTLFWWETSLYPFGVPL